MKFQWRKEIYGEQYHGGKLGWILEYVGRTRIVPVAKLEGDGPYLARHLTPYMKTANAALAGGYAVSADDRKPIVGWRVTCSGGDLFVQGICPSFPWEGALKELPPPRHAQPDDKILELRVRRTDKTDWHKVEFPT